MENFRELIEAMEQLEFEPQIAELNKAIAKAEKINLDFDDLMPKLEAEQKLTEALNEQEAQLMPIFQTNIDTKMELSKIPLAEKRELKKIAKRIQKTLRVEKKERKIEQLKTLEKYQQLVKILGFKLRVVDSDENTIVLKLTFSRKKYAIIEYANEAKTFDLQKLEPPHPNYEAMRAFLLKTSDISGFLFNMREYFNQCYVKKE